MNFRKLFYGGMAFLAVTAVSCSNDPAGDSGKGGKGGSADAYFSLTLRGAQGMRAWSYVPGTANEAQVNNVLAVLYDVNTMTVAYPIEFQIATDGSVITDPTDINTGKANTATTFSTTARKIKKQDYKLLVVLNATADIIAATAEGMSFSAFSAVQTVTNVEDLIGAGATPGNFIMSNWQDLVALDGDSDIYEEEDDALDNPVSVNVERAVSKIMVYYDDANVTLQNWALDVVNTQTTWMRVPTLNNAGLAESDDKADRYQNYAKDPNFDAWHSWEAWKALNGVPANQPAQRSSDFKFIDMDGVVGWIAPAKVTDATANFAYVPENTMAATQQYRDVTTSVIMKVKYAPTTSALGAAIAPNTPYFAFFGAGNRYVFTAQELQAAYDYFGTNGVAQDYDNEEIETFMTNINAYYALLGGATFAAYSGASVNLAKDFVYFDANQVNYYRVPIRHYDNVLQPIPMAYGRFGVVRNNIYKITLNEVYGPGAATVNDPETPGPEDPEGPDEDSVAWFSATIEILDWVLREHDVVVGD